MKAMSTRQERVAEQLRQVIASLLRRGDFLDEHVAKLVDVPFVWVSADLRTTRVYFTLLEEGYAADNIRDLTKYLNSTSFQLQKELNRQLHLKRTPKIHFLYDKDADRTHRVEALFRKVEQQSKVS